MHNNSSSEWEWIKRQCNNKRNNDDNDEQTNLKLSTFKTESITKSESKAKVIMKKWHILSVHILTKEKSINKRQIQICSNCSFCESDFLQCSKHTRCILQSAHTVHL